MNIDAEIAEKLFDQRVDPKAASMLDRTKPFTSNCSNLDAVLEALRKKGFWVEIHSRRDMPLIGEYGVRIGRLFNHDVESNEDTLPLALCKAALLALEGK